MKHAVLGNSAVRVFFLLLAFGMGGLAYLCGGWAVTTWQTSVGDADLVHWLVFGAQGLLAVGTGLATVILILASLPEGDPLKDDRWRDILFREHPKARLRTWARSLRYFRFVRGSGGGMDDHGDCLRLALRTSSLGDIETILSRIGATALPPFSDRIDRSDGPVGESTCIQIGSTPLTGYRCFGRLELSLADQEDSWRVTQGTVDTALSLEPLFDCLADRLIDPPQDDRHCLCPKYYPAFWGPEPPKRRGRQVIGPSHD